MSLLDGNARVEIGQYNRRDGCSNIRAGSYHLVIFALALFANLRVEQGMTDEGLTCNHHAGLCGRFGACDPLCIQLGRPGPAHVTVLIPEIEPYSPARIERAKELVQSAANRADVTCTVLPESHAAPVRETLVDLAQVRDIVTINVRGALRYPRQGLVEAVLFGSGQPIILVPPGAHAPAGARALIAWIVRVRLLGPSTMLCPY